jgi:hypothetical protein
MKTYLSIIGGIAMLALLVAVPAKAEMTAVGDSDMAGISGKAGTANDYTFSSNSVTNQLNSNDSSSNIQVGWFQWNDDHTSDVSDHKGANDQAGDTSSVQQNIVADHNAINWGAWSSLSWKSSGDTSTGTIAQMPYAIMAVGGF